MISQIQGLQAFFMNHLTDVVDWGKHVRPELERYPKQGDGKPQLSGDMAHILITTPFNRYRMSILSSYLEPPPGAPLACKSLGTVTFDDMADNKHIVGPKADQTWTDISKHIHVRELTDGLAAARRELAEGNGSAAKLVDLAERAKKWGIAAKVPEAAAALNPHPMQRGLAATIPDLAQQMAQGTAINNLAGTGMVPIHTTGLAAPASRDAPWLGAPIIFITNPGEQIGGMQEIVGWCVKVYSRDRISLFMTPDHSEPSYRDNLPRRGSPAGNGKVHQFNCWDFNPEAMRLVRSVIGIEGNINRIDMERAAIERRIEEILGRVIALEGDAPKRRGRPSKTVQEMADAPDAELKAMGIATTDNPLPDEGEAA